MVRLPVPLGAAVIFACPLPQPGGLCKPPLPLRAQRALICGSKLGVSMHLQSGSDRLAGKGMIHKKGKTAGCLLLVRLPRAAAPFPPPAGGVILTLMVSG